MKKKNIEITLKFEPLSNEKEEKITEEEVWVIILAAKSYIESRNTIIEVLGNKAEEFLNQIVEIKEVV